jgi:hypothetical protein
MVNHPAGLIRNRGDPNGWIGEGILSAIPNLPVTRIHAGFCLAWRWFKAFEREVEQRVPALEPPVSD